MQEISKPPSIPWYYGLVPPAWCFAQAVIVLLSVNSIVHPNLWTFVLGAEAIVTYVLMIRWLWRLTGPKSPRTIKFMTISWTWILICIVGYLAISFRIPRPDYSKIPKGPNYSQLAQEASEAHFGSVMYCLIGYGVIMFTGLVALMFAQWKTDWLGLREPASR